MNTTDILGIILAAGKGTRMHSERPKVMQRLLEEPMVRYVYASVQAVVKDICLITGYGAEEVESVFLNDGVEFVRQEKQLGTGHAVQCAWSKVEDDRKKWCLVVNGDAPLLRPEDVRYFIQQTVKEDSDLSFFTMEVDNPEGYGKIIRRPDGQCTAIVEAKDYDPEKHGQSSNEVNAGIYMIKTSSMGPFLFQLSDSNEQKEFYITDLIELGITNGKKVQAVKGEDNPYLLGINTPQELVTSERFLQEEIITGWLEKGVIVHNPSMVRIGPRVKLEAGCELTGPCELYGDCTVEKGVRIDSHCWIKDTRILSNCHIRSFCHLEGADIEESCVIGPYARLRPGTRLLSEAKVGNFVEIKKAVLGKGSKASHLTYLGDAEIGSDVNIGAGTITCNYDGKKKHTTTIKDQSFIGSNTALVAPVTIGKRVVIGAGSVITKNVEDDSVAVARGKQKQYPRKN